MRATGRTLPGMAATLRIRQRPRPKPAILHAMNRVLLTAAAAFACGAATIAPAQVPAAHADPVTAPVVQASMFTGKWGTGCSYNVSVRVTDHRAPVQLLIVDPRGRLIRRLATRDERRVDEKRVVESDWVPARPGNVRAVAIQNGVRMQTAPFPVSGGQIIGPACVGV